MKLVNEAITDLEKRKKKAVKRVNELIAKRNQEVEQVRKTIKALETVGQESKEKYKTLKIESDKEIKALQESIKKLNEQLKEFQNKEKQLANEREKRLRERQQKEKEYAQTSFKIFSKSVEKNLEEEIERLKKELEEALFSEQRLNASLEMRQLETEHAKAELEREKDL
jgi:hypothetical protein